MLRSRSRDESGGTPYMRGDLRSGGDCVSDEVLRRGEEVAGRGEDIERLNPF